MTIFASATLRWLLFGCFGGGIVSALVQWVNAEILLHRPHVQKRHAAHGLTDHGKRVLGVGQQHEIPADRVVLDYSIDL